MARLKKIPRKIKEVFPSNHNPENWLLVECSEFYATVQHKTIKGAKMRFDLFSKSYV